MGRGCTILQKEVAEDLRALEKTQSPETCGFAAVVRNALKRALRLGEAAHICSRRNTYLLLLLLVLTIKVQGIGAIELILKLLVKGL